MVDLGDIRYFLRIKGRSLLDSFRYLKLKKQLRIIFVLIFLAILILSAFFYFSDGITSYVVFDEFNERVNDSTTQDTPQISKSSILFNPLTEEDILSDRVTIKNVGDIALSNFEIKIDGKSVGIVRDKVIEKLSSETLYLKEYYPAGTHILEVSSGEHKISMEINIPEDYHVVVV